MIVPIIEGQAEEESIRLIMARTSVERGWPWPSVGKPIRVGRNKVVKAGELERKIDLAIRSRPGATAILLLLDADDDCPAQLGPALLERGKAAAGGRVSFGVVLANRELEAWFLADVSSLASDTQGVISIDLPRGPEAPRDAKGLLADALGRRYSSVIDQPSFAARFNVAAASERCRSFRKFEKEIKAALEA